MTDDPRALIALAAAPMVLGAFLLSLVALDMIAAAVQRLWLLVSPRAARRARFRAALVAYRGSHTERRRKT